MKNVFSLMFALILMSGCVTKSSKENLYSYEHTKKTFVIGKTTAQEVINLLGQPSEKRMREKYFSLDFVDPKTGYQKISAAFSETDGKLTNFFWIPDEKDPQITLSEAMGDAKPSEFKIEISERDRVHGISKVKFYINKEYGQSIRYNESLKQVEGIAFFDGSMRTPASNK